jgi:hypothetical protein
VFSPGPSLNERNGDFSTVIGYALILYRRLRAAPTRATKPDPIKPSVPGSGTAEATNSPFANWYWPKLVRSQVVQKLPPVGFVRVNNSGILLLFITYPLMGLDTVAGTHAEKVELCEFMGRVMLPKAWIEKDEVKLMSLSG